MTFGSKARGLLRRIAPRKPGMAPRDTWLNTLIANVQGVHPRSRLDGYDLWLADCEARDASNEAGLRRRLADLADPPSISVVMPVYNVSDRWLRDAIASVQAQVYPHWELCIADDGSSHPHIARRLKQAAAADSRIRVTFLKERGHISRASNAALETAQGEWIALLDHDDLLHPHALGEVALEIAQHPSVQLIYTDEDKIDERGRRYDPYFKPDFSRELFRSQNYLNHLTVHRAANIRDTGGWREGYEGSQDYDLNLRIFERIAPQNIRHIPKVLYHWRASRGSAAQDAGSKDYAHAAGLRALQDHVRRTGLAAAVEGTPDMPYYRVKMRVPEPQPRVSLIVPTRDRVELLRTCVESILDRTSYGNFEILVVDNQSRDPAACAYLDRLRTMRNVRVLSFDRPFNFSAINNFAAAQASGSVLGLINNDIDVLSPDWLTEMVSWAMLPDVGCVGAKLYYPDGTIQHGGVILGIGGVAGHAHKYFPRGSGGYFGRLKLVQNLSAVTGACLVVRKDVYESVGGLNETDLAIAFNDVDFCLRVREAGYVNLWTPYAELYHSESRSRGAEDTPEKVARFNREVQYMTATWAGRLQRDPYYSVNLTSDHEDYSFRKA